LQKHQTVCRRQLGFLFLRPCNNIVSLTSCALFPFAVSNKLCWSVYSVKCTIYPSRISATLQEVTLLTGGGLLSWRDHTSLRVGRHCGVSWRIIGSTGRVLLGLLCIFIPQMSLLICTQMRLHISIVRYRNYYFIWYRSIWSHLVMIYISQIIQIFWECFHTETNINIQHLAVGPNVAAFLQVAAMAVVGLCVAA